MRPEIDIEDYVYDLPENRIAERPLTRRDAAKLLVWKDGEGEDAAFAQLPDFLPPETLLVLNETKVIPVRLIFARATGALIEIFCLSPEAPSAAMEQALDARGACRWACMVGNLKRWKEGEVLEIAHEGLVLRARLAERAGAVCSVAFEWAPDALSFAEVLDKLGRAPLPPYIKRPADAADKTRYQTVYANRAGSAAAPTAGLHFTPEVFSALDAKGVLRQTVTLHVGAGTFKPVGEGGVENHEMHVEPIQVSRAAVQRILDALPDVVAVGTTSMRTLESLYWLGLKAAKVNREKDASADWKVGQWEPYDTAPEQQAPAAESLRALLAYMDAKDLDELYADTQLLIMPGYELKVCKGLVTNFHLPRSTLLLLIAAVVGEDWRRIYDRALANDYRFLSYGDSSLLWAKG